jgi:hypothetical protein
MVILHLKKHTNMKKIGLLFTAAAGFAMSASAQFIEQVGFVGALENDATQDWTKGWANWNPKTTVYGVATDSTTLNDASGKKVLSGTVTLNASTVYLLKSFCVVPSGAKLVVPAGTIIRGMADANASPKLYATIIVERGGMIELNGTSSSPVILTSNKAVGSRERGDWGGLVLSGKAVNNQGVDVQLEGFSNVAFDNTLGKHGGTDDGDNSGTITYTRVEFAGYAFEPNKEINGVTFGSVGNKTVVNGMQVSYSGDDAYEWFGGTVNAKHLIAFKTTDDDFDTDFGYRGAVQFGIAYRDSSYYDLSWNAPSGSSTSETFESDNDASGSGLKPYTAPLFSNITCIGPIGEGQKYSNLGKTAQSAFRRGARIRRNSRLSIINSIFTGYRNFVMFDGDSVLVAAGVKPNGTVTGTSNLFRNNYIVNTASAAATGVTNTGLAEVDSKNTPAGLDAWMRLAANGNSIDDVTNGKGNVLVDIQNNDFRIIAGKATSTMANFNNSVVDLFGKFNAVNNISEVSGVSVYPNPAVNEINVDFNSNIAFNGTVKLMDLSGKTLIQKSINALEGLNNISFETSNVSNGIYLVVMSSNKGQFSQKVIVNK